MRRLTVYNLVSFIHFCVVGVVGKLPYRLWAAYGDRFEHQGQTFWDSAYYKAEIIDTRVYDWFQNRLHSARKCQLGCGNEADGYACGCTDAVWE